jgi:hypothetical protein
MSQDLLNEKMLKWPYPARQAAWAIRDAVEDWQGLKGGYKKGMGAASRAYITRSESGGYSHEEFLKARHIVEAVRNAPERQGSLYRGIGTYHPLQVFEDAKPGDVIRIDGLSSFSRSSKQADSFIHPSSYTYRIIVDGRYKGIDAKFQGDFVGEQETITYGRFRVIRKFQRREPWPADPKHPRMVTNLVVRQLETH